jgi:hypothetical protein
MLYDDDVRPAAHRPVMSEGQHKPGKSAAACSIEKRVNESISAYGIIDLESMDLLVKESFEEPAPWQRLNISRIVGRYRKGDFLVILYNEHRNIVRGGTEIVRLDGACEIIIETVMQG